MGWTSLSISVLVALITTLFCIQLLRPVAIHIGLVDVPGGRKKHGAPIPLIGGLSIFMGYCLALLCLDIPLSEYRGLLAGSAILILIGVVDDFKELAPRTRLLGQCLATLFLIEWGHITISHLGNLFHFGNLNLGIGIWSSLITVFIVMGFINAINLIDGQDGLAGFIILGETLSLACYNLKYHQIKTTGLLLIFAVSLCVFLCFNVPLPWRKRASIFLGDAGSTFAGFVIAWFSIYLSQLLLSQEKPVIGYNLVTVLWVLAYPLYDITAVILHRLITRRSPFSASRDHLHYVLSDRYVSPNIATFILLGISLSFGLFGFFLACQHIREFWQLMIFIGVFIAYFLATLFLQKKDLRKK